MLRNLLLVTTLACAALFSPAAEEEAEAREIVLANPTSAGTALTNSTTETVLASTTLAPYSLQPGKVYHLHGTVIATATNSTDTLTVNIEVGPTTLTGTAVATTGAVDVADNNVMAFDIWFTVRNASSASVVIASGTGTILGAEGTATSRVVYESLSLDNSVTQRVEVTGTWSVASASNSCRSDQFILTELI